MANTKAYKRLKTIKPKKHGIDVPEKPYYPSFHISSKELPEIKNWEVGRKYRILLETRQVGKREDEEGISGDFEIRKIAKGGGK